MKRREFLGSIVALPCLAATVKHKKQPVVAARPTPPGNSALSCLP